MNKETSRREFMIGASLAAGGVMLSCTLLASSKIWSPNDKLKLAVVGCGGRGTGAVQQALTADSGVELVAMSDAFEDRLESSYSTLLKIFGKDRLKVPQENKFVGFGTYKQAIDMADVVILTTPPGWRPDHFAYAIEKGKHVFMEKPVATDVAGIKKVLDAAKKAKEKNLNVVVGLQRHYQHNYRALYDLLQKGKIGDIVSGQVYWNGSGVWVRERQAGMTEMEYQMRNWYYFNWLCGDHILEQHIHNIDVANWFIGDYPVSAQGMGGREVRKGKDHGQIFDHHFVEFVYPNGAVISSQCRHIEGTMHRVSEMFQGTKGQVYTDGGGNGWMKKYNGSEIYKHDSSNDISPYQVEHNELFANIRSGATPINNAEYGAKSTMTAILGRMATYTGKVVTWEEAMNSNHEIVPEETSLNWNSVPPVKPDGNGNYPVAIPGKTKIEES